MKIFKLPDLGEGLPDAEIVEWHVKEGDIVKTDELLVSMETAKAVVDVPSPQNGKIGKLCGKPGDIIKTGAALVEFIDSTAEMPIEPKVESKAEPKKEKAEDKGTVAGAIEVGNTILQQSATGVVPVRAAKQQQQQQKFLKAMPSVRALAKKLDVDLKKVNPSGPKGRTTADDVKNAAASVDPAALGASVVASGLTVKTVEPLRGPRRAMANAMVKSHAEVVPVTLMDDADIHAWLAGTDITWRVIRAIVAACRTEPALNAHFNMEKLERTLFPDINIGIAMDSPEGLFVPVLKNAEKHDQASFRKELDRFKTLVKSRSIAPQDLTGSTIQLSNFGTFAGRYANPIIVPPNVAIIGLGKIREEVVAVNNAIAIHRVMPLSVSIDHRGINGGEAARFLKALMDDLQKSH